MSSNGCDSNHSSIYANEEVEDSPCVLSIQSHVVHGYVGNKSATFPLQVLGFEVDAINTVQFSTHTHYEHFKGHVITNSQMGDLIDGLQLNKVDNYTHLLTGYSRDPQALHKVANVVKDMRKKNPKLIYVCDPVMGDDGKMYVPEEILPVYQETIIPLADIVTPNQFEAELLTGIKINNVSDAQRAIQCLHAKGIKVVILSSTELGDEHGMLGLASILDGDCFSIKIPKFPVHFTGTGDLFTALMLAWTYKTNTDLKLSLEKTIATMQHIIKDTYLFAKKKYGDVKMTCDKVELRLIQNKSFIDNPVVEIEASVYRS